MVTRPVGVAAKPYAVSSLKRISVDPEKLIRVSRHNTNEPYFGNSRRNRFDDPVGKYGTCYFGMSLAVAVAETLLHDRGQNEKHSLCRSLKLPAGSSLNLKEVH
jgi:hypothetical protein